MSQPPQTTRPVPAHRRPLAIDIPRIWTPEAALAVVEPLIAGERVRTVILLFD